MGQFFCPQIKIQHINNKPPAENSAGFGRTSIFNKLLKLSLVMMDLTEQPVLKSVM